jgi:hypothetical protein
MARLKIKVDGQEYDYPDPGMVEMGDLRAVKREYGLADFSELNLRDAEHICAMAFLAMRCSNRNLPKQALVDQLDRARKIELVDLDAPEADPTKAADAAEGSAETGA